MVASADNRFLNFIACSSLLLISSRNSSSVFPQVCGTAIFVLMPLRILRHARQMCTLFIISYFTFKNPTLIELVAFLFPRPYRPCLLFRGRLLSKQGLHYTVDHTGRTNIPFDERNLRRFRPHYLHTSSLHSLYPVYRLSVPTPSIFPNAYAFHNRDNQTL